MIGGCPGGRAIGHLGIFVFGNSSLRTSQSETARPSIAGLPKGSSSAGLNQGRQWVGNARDNQWNIRMLRSVNIGMRLTIPYRFTSSIAVSAFGVLIIGAFFQTSTSTPAISNRDRGGWNLCSAWVNYGSMHNLMVIISFGAFIVLTIQGLRSRSGPRWLAILGLLSLIVLIEDEWWQITKCYSLCNNVWLTVPVMVLLHHTFQRPIQPIYLNRPTRLARFASAIVLGAFASLVLIWFVLSQFMLIVATRHPHLVEDVILRVEPPIGFTSLVLFPFATAITLSRLRGASQRLE